MLFTISIIFSPNFSMLCGMDLTRYHIQNVPNHTPITASNWYLTIILKITKKCFVGIGMNFFWNGFWSLSMHLNNIVSWRRDGTQMWQLQKFLFLWFVNWFVVHCDVHEFQMDKIFQFGWLFVSFLVYLLSVITWLH